MAKARRNYAEEHRQRKQITPGQRRAREAKRADRTRTLVEAGAIAWSSGNEKLRKLGILSFGIPAGVAGDGFNTCPAKGACAGWCYARQGFYVWPHVAAALERNLAIVRGDLERFTRRAISDLATRKGTRVVRVHDSGDFFSAEYLRAWFTIARRLPEITFYAYTKMFHRFKSTFALAPRNFRVIQSLGGQDDAHVNLGFSHARVFVTHAEREAAGYVDGTQDDGPAINGVVKIGLVYHSGGKRLTEAQVYGMRAERRVSLADATPADRLAVGLPLKDESDEAPLVALTLKAAVEFDGDVTSEADVVARAVPPDPPSADPLADGPGPEARTVTIALNQRQWELLGNLVSVGALGDSKESAAGWILAEGLLRHFPKAFASLGFKA